MFYIEDTGLKQIVYKEELFCWHYYEQHLEMYAAAFALTYISLRQYLKMSLFEEASAYYIGDLIIINSDSGSKTSIRVTEIKSSPASVNMSGLNYTIPCFMKYRTCSGCRKCFVVCFVHADTYM